MFFQLGSNLRTFGLGNFSLPLTGSTVQPRTTECCEVFMYEASSKRGDSVIRWLILAATRATPPSDKYLTLRRQHSGRLSSSAVGPRRTI